MKSFLISALILITNISFGQNFKLPNNPLKGRIVFEEKGCIDCHSIGGFGGKIGPDLLKQQYFGSLVGLAAIIWNHIPKMNRRMRKMHKSRPRFTKEEMLNLISFLYYLHYLGQPGSVSNGKNLLKKKGCVSCHSINKRGSKIAPNFRTLDKKLTPLFLVQSMWNHFPRMSKKMKDLQKEYPHLTGKEMVDIEAYIKAASSGSGSLNMTPGNPERGRLVFKKKNCVKCHFVGEKSGKKYAGPELKKVKLNKSVTEIAALMWNHAPAMFNFMKRNRINWPTFKGTEMADLIAYLYFLNFQSPPGNAEEGKEVFKEKGCANCHYSGSKIAPNLLKQVKFSSPIELIQKMWNHGAKMEDKILMFNFQWPNLSEKEMRDLYSYLTKNYIRGKKNENK